MQDPEQDSGQETGRGPGEALAQSPQDGSPKQRLLADGGGERQGEERHDEGAVAARRVDELAHLLDQMLGRGHQTIGEHAQDHPTREPQQDRASDG